MGTVAPGSASSAATVSIGGLSGARRNKQPIGLALIITSAVVAVTAALLYAKGVHGLNFSVFTKDPNSIAGQPEFYGVITYVGVIGWMLGALVAIYSWLVLRRFGVQSRYGAMLLAGGLLSAFALVDDLFMFHDGLAERIGIPEVIILAGYAALGLLWAALSLRKLLETEWLLAILGLGGLAVSVFIDLGLFEFRGMLLAEDMTKLFGILCWNACLVRLGWRVMGELLHARVSPPS